MFTLAQHSKALRSSLFSLFVVFSLSILLSGCDKAKTSDKPVVVSTIGMIDDIVKNIGGEHVYSQSLMGPGVDPHLYKASEGDVRTLSSADLILYNGLHLESKMIDIFEKLKATKQVYAVTSKIQEYQLRAPAEYDGLHDPHVWFDVSLWLSAAEVVKEALIKLDPENKLDYTKNAALYFAKLMRLDKEVKDRVLRLPKNKRYLVTAHDAFGYFGKAYGFEVHGLQGMSTEAEAGAKDVQNLASFIVEKKIPTIFVESSVPERHIKAVQAAVRAKGWSVSIGGELFADAMGTAGTAEGTYVGMVRHNVNTIVNGLTK